MSDSQHVGLWPGLPMLADKVRAMYSSYFIDVFYAFAVVSIIYIAFQFARVFYIFVWRPLSVLRKLQRQGVPGCKFVPLVGQTRELLHMRDKIPNFDDSTLSPIPFYDIMHSKYGSVYTYCAGFIPRLVINDPALIKQFLVTNNDCYIKNRIMRNFSLFGNGLLTSSGTLWAHQRKIIKPAFNIKEIKQMMEIMRECVDATVTDWDASMGPQEGKLEMYEEFSRLAMTIMGRTSFGGSSLGAGDGEQAELQQCLQVFLRHMPDLMKTLIAETFLPGSKYLPTELDRRVAKDNSFIRSTMTDIIDRHHKVAGTANTDSGLGGKIRKDLLDLMIQASDEFHESGGSNSKMSDKQLMDECLTFLIAGHETIAILLVWTTYFLAKHPDWQDKARAEVQDVCGSSAPSQYEALANLKIVGMVMNESLRMYPPSSSLSRECVIPNRLGDIDVPVGVDVTVPTVFVHRNEELWGKDAHLFKPERFEDGVASAAKHPMAFLPFAAGPRSCLGTAFATTEVKFILAVMLRKYTWKLAPEYVHYPELSLTQIKPKYGLPILFQRI